ncbi:MAG: acyltransferase [Lachnospiraceae bacterium]|nr:acyltransferase [Lachnospiraceae bacterium]
MDTPITNERNSYIDLCRAIAVLDVLAGHTAFWVMFWETPNWVKSLTLLFEVPTFFFLSGWASSLRTPDVKKSLQGLTRFWMQWIYFVTVMAIVCVASSSTASPIEGISGPADFMQNYFFTVSFPGLSIVSISLWWVGAFFVVIPLMTALIMLIKRTRHPEVFEILLCVAAGVVFLVWSLRSGDFGSGTVYREPVTAEEVGLKNLVIMGSSESGVTLPFLAFFWLLGYNRKRIRIDRWWKLMISEAVVITAYLMSVGYYGIGWDDIQTAKFPPAAPYLFSSMILIFVMLYLEQFVKKTGRILPHIGKNAPFYFFAQGVTSSLCTRIKPFIPGSSDNFNAIVAGEATALRFNPAPYLILLLINILMAIALAEALAFSYSLIKKAVMMQPLRTSWPIPVIILAFVFVMVFYESVNAPGPFGEWDDYSFPIVSMLQEHRISVTDRTIQGVKEWLYPGWDWMVNGYKLSGMYTADGGQLPWYFPLYAIICMPAVLLLRRFSIPPMHAFPLTNIAVVALALLIAGRFLKTDNKRRTILVLLLAVHPAIFYISNISAEALIYALLIIGCTFWYNRWYRPAAVVISLAGMLNPTIMIMGVVMILEYLEFEGYYYRPKDNLINPGKWAGLISFGACFIPALLPMAYNYYHTGHINLTAATKELVTGNETTLQRAWAYITDLNYGMLPYFPILCLIALVLLFIVLVRIRNVFAYAMPHRYRERRELMGEAAKKKAKAGTRYIEWMVTFMLNLILVSTVIHINSGMCAIARYNVWLSVVPIFAIVFFGHDVVDVSFLRRAAATAVTAGAVLTGVIVYAYYPHFAMNVQYTDFSPIADYVLDNLPGLYNPIPSTFVARSEHIDGGYDYETPVIYYGHDGYVRKILATEKDADMLVNNYRSAYKDIKWYNRESFENQAKHLSESPGYISVPGRYRVTIRDQQE